MVDLRLNKLADAISLNIGLVFTDGEMKTVRSVLEKNKVVSGAKAGAIAPVDGICQHRLYTHTEVLRDNYGSVYFESIALHTRKQIMRTRTLCDAH